MAGPWEKYGKQEEKPKNKPWETYQKVTREDLGKMLYPFVETFANIEGLPNTLAQGVLSGGGNVPLPETGGGELGDKLRQAQAERKASGEMGPVRRAAEYVTQHTGTPQFFSEEVQKAGVPSVRAESVPGRLAQDVTTGGLSALATGVTGLGPVAASAVGGLAAGGAREMGAEPKYQALAGIMAPIMGMGAFNALVLRTPSRILGQAIRGSSEQELKAAAQLMRDAHAMGKVITLPEALNQVTKGAFPRAAYLQRFVEQSPAGSSQMGRIMAARAETGDAAINRVLNRPTGEEKVGVPLAFQSAAKEVVKDTRKDINKQTKQLYAAAEPQKVDPQDFAAIQAHPAWERSLKAVRRDPLKYGDLTGYPDDSIKVIDAVKKYADDTASEAGRAGRNYAATNAGDFAGDLKYAATKSSPEYDLALKTQEQLRKDVLGPVKRGPVGQIAEESSLSGQLGKLIPIGKGRTATPQDVEVLKNHLTMLGKKDPKALQNFVDEALGDAFDYVGRGASQLQKQGQGAAFTKFINGPDGKLLQTLVEHSGPNGAAKWQAFQKILKVMEAEGHRLPGNSPTTFNTMIERNLSSPGVIPLSPSDVNLLSHNSLWNQAVNWYRTGARADRIFELMIDPANESKWVLLAKAKPGTQAATKALFGLLGAQSTNENR